MVAYFCLAQNDWRTRYSQLRIVESEERLSRQDLRCLQLAVARKQKVLDILLRHHQVELEWAESQRQAGILGRCGGWVGCSCADCLGRVQGCYRRRFYQPM